MNIARQAGFSLLELMVTVAIIGILAGIALPMYNNYVQTGQDGALLASLSTIRVFQDDFRLRNGEYAEGTYNNGADASLAPLGWDPETDEIVFVVVANAGVSYTVTATHSGSGRTLCRQYPSNDPC